MTWFVPSGESVVRGSVWFGDLLCGRFRFNETRSAAFTWRAVLSHLRDGARLVAAFFDNATHVAVEHFFLGAFVKHAPVAHLDVHEIGAILALEVLAGQVLVPLGEAIEFVSKFGEALDQGTRPLAHRGRVLAIAHEAHHVDERSAAQLLARARVQSVRVGSVDGGHG